MAGRPKGSTNETTKAKQAVTADVVETATESVKEVATKQPVKKQYKVKKDLDPKSLITVKNGFQGKLIYGSKRTGERFVWESFGDEQDMELQELKNARNASKSFFSNNWFLIDDPDVIEYLGVKQFYENALDYETFDGLFNKTPAQIEASISKLSNGQKRSVAYRARVLIADGVIDSIKVINALEKSLSTELIER